MILVTAPVDSESGYGHKSREIVKPIAEQYWDEINIAFLPWGQTPRTGLEDTKYEFLKEKKKKFELREQPDLHIHIGLPTEFNQRGKKNILFTSGVETDRISPQWTQAFNKCDLIIVPSSYVKNIITKTTYKDKKGNIVRVKTPVKVIPESYNDKLLESINNEEKSEIDGILNNINESEWFITYGQISEKKILGSERKDVTTLVQEFIKEFSGNKDVALLLKCNPTDFSELSYYQIKNYIQRAINEVRIKDEIKPSVYILEGYLSYQQLFYLMNHDNIVSHITTTHGEGFGRFLLEASLSEKPIIIPKVGAFRDFLSGNSVFYVDGKFEKINKESTFRDVIIKGSKWYCVDNKKLRSQMKKVYKNYKNIDGSELAEKNKEKYSSERIEEEILNTIEDFYVKEVELSIPKM